ncbi:uncharacterized protein LOC120325527 isoform X1 [Styela clava]
MASSSTLLSQINEDFLTCRICMDSYKKPKVLNCQHSFCLSCLESCKTTENGSYMSCPVCRQRTVLGMKGVSGLKDNFVFSNMVEMMENWKRSKSPSPRRSTESLEDAEILCSTCPETEQAMATFQCLDCLDMLCADCGAFHSRTKLTKDHEVVPMQEIENGLHEGRLRLVQLSRCSNHEIQMKNYCNDCDVPVCRDCIVEIHAGHHLVLIEEAGKELKHKVEDMKTDLEQDIHILERSIEEIDIAREKEEDEFKEIQDSIKIKAKTFIDAIKKRRDHLLEKVEEVETENMEKMNNCKDGLETQLKCMENCVQFSNHLLENSTSFEVVTMQRQITETAKELQTKTKEVLERNDETIKSCTDIKVNFGSPEDIWEIFGNIEIAGNEEINKTKIKNVLDDSTKSNSDKETSPKIQPKPTPRRHTGITADMKKERSKFTLPKPPQPTTRRSSNHSIQSMELDVDESANDSPKPAIRRSSEEIKLERQSSLIVEVLPHTLGRPSKSNLKQSQEKARSVMNLSTGDGGLSPARAAPVPPPLSPLPKRVESLRKKKAPKPPRKSGKVPLMPPPLPPPQNKKPLLKTNYLTPIEAKRLVKFGRKGKIITNGEFSGPPRYAIFSKVKKKILVLDGENRHILIFSVEGFFKKSFRVVIPDQGKNNNKYKIAQAKPIAIAEAGTNHILVLFKNFITNWSWDGEMEDIWGTTELIDATSIANDSQGRIFVSDQEKHMIFVYDPHTKHKEMQIGGFGDRDDLFKSPRNICINQFDDVIVSDHHNHCIKVFNKDGSFLYKFGERGTKDGELKYPEGVACFQLEDGKDGILVADDGNCRVSLFTSEGKFLSQVLTKDEDKGLKSPQCVSVSSTGEEMLIRQTNLLQIRVYKLIKVEK